MKSLAPPELTIRVSNGPVTEAESFASTLLFTFVDFDLVLVSLALATPIPSAPGPATIPATAADFFECVIEI